MSDSHVIFGRQYARRYDAIVIGGGIGGLLCANLLAREMKVLLVEKHSVLGGYTSSFRKRGYLLDSATHFYPLLGNPQTLTGKLLRELQIPTEWIKMDPVDRFHFPGMEPFAVPAGFGEYIQKLKSRFFHESAAIDRYFAELRKACMYGLLHYFKGVSNDYVNLVERHTVCDKLDEYFTDQRLKALLIADTPHWGSLPDRTSFLFDAMLRMSYFLGNYYPRGGSQRFADDLGRGIEARGGKVMRCAAAEQIRVSAGAVAGVCVSTVSRRAPERFEFDAPIVVSNADAFHTYLDLIPEAYRDTWILDRMRKMRPSYPCFLLHVGLRGMDPARLQEVEGYHWNSYDYRDAARSVFKIFIPTHFDPCVAPPGCQILIIQKAAPREFDGVVDWSAHKSRQEEVVIQQLRCVLPEVDRHIEVRLSASALTSYRFTGNYQGAMLGWEMSPDQLGSARLPFTTPVRNLYLTGHWTQPGGGITPVIVSAQRVAKLILSGSEPAFDVAAHYLSFHSNAKAAAMEVPA